MEPRARSARARGLALAPFEAPVGRAPACPVLRSVVVVAAGAFAPSSAAPGRVVRGWDRRSQPPPAASRSAPSVKVAWKNVREAMSRRAAWVPLLPRSPVGHPPSLPLPARRRAPRSGRERPGRSRSRVRGGSDRPPGAWRERHRLRRQSALWVSREARGPPRSRGRRARGRDPPCPAASRAGLSPRWAVSARRPSECRR